MCSSNRKQSYRIGDYDNDTPNKLKKYKAVQKTLFELSKK